MISGKNANFSDGVPANLAGIHYCPKDLLPNIQDVNSIKYSQNYEWFF